MARRRAEKLGHLMTVLGLPSRSQTQHAQGKGRQRPRAATHSNKTKVRRSPPPPPPPGPNPPPPSSKSPEKNCLRRDVLCVRQSHVQGVSELLAFNCMSL